MLIQTYIMLTKSSSSWKTNKPKMINRQHSTHKIKTYPTHTVSWLPCCLTYFQHQFEFAPKISRALHLLLYQKKKKIGKQNSITHKLTHHHTLLLANIMCGHLMWKRTLLKQTHTCSCLKLTAKVLADTFVWSNTTFRTHIHLRMEIQNKLAFLSGLVISIWSMAAYFRLETG